jgi:farnesyl diphosphate synthase
MALKKKPIARSSGFERKLERVAARLETRLEQLLSAPGDTAESVLAEAMRYAVLGGGKRVRPFLLIESAGLFASPNDGTYGAAAALECVHCYSLVHDDLPSMDDDALRRGRPTVHVAYDEATAILVGDALLTLAFETLARPETHKDAAVRAELILALARAAGWRGMVEGQALDLAAEGTQVSDDEIARIQALKTGALIEFACDAGAVLGGAPADQRQALHIYGKALGQAFQLADDLLDVDGDSGQVGKATGKDGAAGKATHVASLGVERARARLEALESKAIEALKSFGAKAEALIEAARFVTRRRH